MKKNYPKISVVTPTLNAGEVLEACLESVSTQNYPRNKLEIIIADGGSKDETLKIAKKYGAKIIKNKLKTGEAGKAVGLKVAKGDFIALIDSDNILPTKDWLEQMIGPLLKHPDAIGSEPWSYTWRKQDGFITRYCALIGMNDPFVHFLGIYDRLNLLTGKWTEVPHKGKDYGYYIVAEFGESGVPTIGANGTVFRADFLRSAEVGDYLFDIDVIAKAVKDKGSVRFVKVKNGIIHTFCESDIRKFSRKQRRRVKDYLYYKEKGDRDFDWDAADVGGTGFIGPLKFILYCVTIFPLFFHSIKGYSKKADIAWFFHPLACEITLWEYGWGMLRGQFKRSEESRENWKQ